MGPFKAFVQTRLNWQSFLRGLAERGCELSERERAIMRAKTMLPDQTIEEQDALYRKIGRAFTGD